MNAIGRETDAVQDAPFHGGSLDWAEARFGPQPEGWLDLSTGINPNAYPFRPPPVSVWQRLPDIGAISALRKTAARRYGVSNPAFVIPAPGSQSLIQLLPRLRDKSNIVVLSPTYSEHAVAWRAEGHDVAEISDIASVSNHADVVVVTNPNNPDGRVIVSSTLLNLADQLAARGGWLVVDEAFADAQPEASVAGNVGREGLIVLRSFGKFYGLAGLRLGFALAPKRVADEISVKLGPWSVAGPAIAISGEALADETWHAETRLHLAEAVKRLDNLLGGTGLTVVGGTPLFRFMTDARSASVFETLGRSGILVRHFPEQQNWLRFGIPEDDAAFDRLARALDGVG